MRTLQFTAAVALLCGTALTGCSKRYESEPRMAPASGTAPTSSAYPDTNGTASPEPGTDLYAPSSSTEGSSDQDTAARTSDQAIDALTEARCAHQSRCGRIGSNRQFAAWDDCVNDERAHARANMTGCATRISGTALEACLNDIRTQDCDAMPDSVDRVQSCASAKLCAPDLQNHNQNGTTTPPGATTPGLDTTPGSGSMPSTPGTSPGPQPGGTRSPTPGGGMSPGR